MLVIVGIFGTFLGGGAITIALLPIGLIVLASAIGYGMYTRAKAGDLGLETEAHPSVNQPLPHEHRSPRRPRPDFARGAGRRSSRRAMSS